jgi:stage II sporulation protein M
MNKHIRYLWEIRLYILINTIVFLSSVLIGYYHAGYNPSVERMVVESFQDRVESILGIVPTDSVLYPLMISVMIFLNNSFVSLISMFSSILPPFFLSPPFLLSINGYVVGVVIHSTPSPFFALITILPHGVLEVPMVIFAVSMGTKIGVEVVKFIFRRKSEVRKNIYLSMRTFVFLLLPLLLIAAFIEVFVSSTLAYTLGV